MADTFADYLTRGTTRGVGFRFVIEGCPIEPVSDLAMEMTLADGRRRVRGLDASGLGLTESLAIERAELDLAPSSIKITETSGQFRDAATSAFTSFLGSSNRTWLDAAVAVADTSITVRDTTGTVVDDVIHVGTEAMLVTAVTDAVTLAVTRGVWRTTPQAFQVETASTEGLELDLVPVSSEPACYAGRRCWLYGHGLDDFDDASDTAGQILWRGIVSSDPELDSNGVDWTIATASRLSLFDAKIGTEKNATSRLRGVYYPDIRPFMIWVTRSADAFKTGLNDGDFQLFMVGFWETQQEWCEALALAINTEFATQGWSGSVECRPNGYGSWELFYTAAAASPRFVEFQHGSPVDGSFDGTLMYTPTGSVEVAYGFVSAGFEYRAGWGPLSSRFTVSHALPPTSLRKMPRANYIKWLGALPSTSFPVGRWYLDRIVGYDVGGTLVITPPATDGGDAEPLAPFAITSRDAGGYIEASGFMPELQDWGAAGEVQPTLDVALRLNTTSGTDLAGFMSEIITTSPDVCNTGVLPLITDDDVDLASWTAAVARVTSGRRWLELRDYVFGSPVKLIDILTHEFRAYGVFPYSDADGKIALRELTPEVDVPTFVVDASVCMPDGESFGSMRSPSDNLIGAILAKTDYDTREDKHFVERTFQGRGIQAAAKGKAQTLEIAPYVNPASGEDITVDELKGQASSLLSLYGSRRYVYDIPVKMTAHSLRVGDRALLTIPQLPYAGRRGATTPGTGLSGVSGRVIARSFQYGEEPRGRLTFEVHGLDIAGYAPTARYASNTGGAADEWFVDFEAAHYGPGGAITDTSLFVIGDRITLDEWDADSPASYPGVVTDITGANSMQLNFDGAGWPGPASATWNLRLADATDAALSVTEKRYAYIANADGAIEYDSGDARARIFA